MWVEVGEGWGRPEVTFVFALVIIGILERQGFSMVFGRSGPLQRYVSLYSIVMFFHLFVFPCIVFFFWYFCFEFLFCFWGGPRSLWG